MKNRPLLLASIILLTACGTDSTSVSVPSANPDTQPTTSEIGTTESSLDNKSSETIVSSETQDGTKLINVLFPTDKKAIDLSTNTTEFNAIKQLFGKHLLSMEVSKIYADEGGIRVSSASAEGIWTLNFDTEVKALSVMAKPYCKQHYDDKTWYVDAIKLDANGITFMDEEAKTSSTEPELTYKEYKVDLGTPSKQVVLTGEGGARPLISSMIITLK